MLNNIVIFGPDNAGKSQLVSDLIKFYNRNTSYSCQSVHTPGPVGKEGMKQFIANNLVSGENVKIFDRLPVIEEEVYGNLLRDGSVFKDEPEYIKSVLDKIDLFIYCYPGLFNVLNWGDREQYPGVKENALEMINMYNKIAVDLKSKGYNVREYNYRVDKPQRMLDGNR